MAMLLSVSCIVISTNIFLSVFLLEQFLALSEDLPWTGQLAVFLNSEFGDKDNLYRE